jgi:cell division protein FtsB
MNLLVELKNRARHVVGPLLGVSAVIYFAYHAVNGDRGLMAWLELKDRVQAAEEAAETVALQRRKVETRVRLLHPDSLDPDMIEERARIMLNFAYADDVVIPEPRTEPLLGTRNEKRNMP